MKVYDLYCTVQEMSLKDVYEVTMDGVTCGMTLRELTDKNPDGEVLKVSISKKKITIL